MRVVSEQDEPVEARSSVCSCSPNSHQALGFSASCLSSADLDWLPVLIDDDDDDDDDWSIFHPYSSLLCFVLSFHRVASVLHRGTACSSVTSPETSWPAPGSEKVWTTEVHSSFLITAISVVKHTHVCSGAATICSWVHKQRSKIIMTNQLIKKIIDRLVDQKNYC